MQGYEDNRMAKSENYVEDRDAGNINTLLSELDCELSDLSRVTHQLANRLEPVMKAETPKPADPNGVIDDSFVNLSPVAQMLKERIYQVRFTRNHIADLTERIDY